VQFQFAPRALLVSCVAFAAYVSTAAADPAPIVYAAATQTEPFHPQVSPEDGELVGGDAHSYGYGAQRHAPANAAVIDIRRPDANTAVTQQQPPAQQAAATPVADEGQGRPQWLETERVGPPYEANGRWYVPTPEPGYSVNGIASWYGPSFHGQRGANGEVYDQEAMTAAHPTLPLNSLVQVTNLANGREVIVRVTDRGPFVGDRVIDLSHAAAHVLGYDATGTAHVNVRYLGPAPRRVNADGSLAAADAPAQAEQPQAAPASAQQAAAQSNDGPVSLAPPQTASAPAPASAETQLAGAPTFATGAGSYFVQVGAFSDVDNAHRVRDAVAGAGPVVLDTRRTAAGAELFRVRVGPWPTRAAADAARQSVAALGFTECVVAAP
jgi:rare lipoprotein A